jgi:ribosomal protein S8
MKKSGIQIIIFIAVILFLYFLYKLVFDGTSFFSSNVFNKQFEVRGNTSEIKQIKSNLLGDVYNRLETLVSTLRNDQTLNSNVPVQRLISNWDRGIILKETGNMESDAAYVINKKYMSICLVNFCDTTKCSNINSLENLNLLAYVGIHELAHIMSEEIGHSTEFRTNFRFLLKYAKNINYYDEILKRNIKLYIDLNQLPTPDNFCGVSVVNTIS